mmetsp:Transcript_22735/g.50584  ORF Transcript_22735/g.50584 Transcript_22735/m.50584 type:complete len:291 (-) Transcript_22735:1026-1898(-)
MLQILRVLVNAHAGLGELRLVKVEREPPEDHGEGDSRLERGELVSNALPRTAAEGEVGEVARHLVGVEEVGVHPPVRVVATPLGHIGVHVPVLRLPPLRDELVGLRPEPLVAVQVVQGDEHVHPPDDGGLLPASLGEVVLRPTPPNEQWRLGVHPQRLGNDKSQILHFPDILVGRCAVTYDTVDLCRDFGHFVRVLCQLEQRPGQDGGGRLVSGDEHRHQIVTKLLIVYVRPPHVDEESQQRRVLHVCVVPLFELLNVLDLTGILRAIDEVRQDVVEDLEVVVELPQAGH